jgi:hypothetical protein
MVKIGKPFAGGGRFVALFATVIVALASPSRCKVARVGDACQKSYALACGKHRHDRHKSPGMRVVDAA